MNNDSELINSYNIRYESFSKLESLTKEHVSISKKYFENSSLLERNPLPLKLDVYCVVAGLPFDINFIKYLKKIKTKLLDILSNSLNYLVQDSCHAVVLIVVKWPDDDFNETISKRLIKFFKNNYFKPIILRTAGIQVHDDGCIILRCIDENSQFRLLRKDIINEIGQLPKKQSNWVHIPLGRILEPLNIEQTSLLKKFCLSTQISPHHTTTINKFYYVHEKQWYQTQIEFLHTFNAI